MRKKVLVDIYLAYNLGDDMFLDYLAHKYPDIDFTPFHPGRNYAVFFSKYDNVKQFPYTFFEKIKSRLGKSLLTDYTKLSERYDGLLFLGGGIFREESYWEEVYAYRTGIVAAFNNRQKPIWFMGCNFGPFKSDLFKNRHQDLFAAVDKVHFRDQKSYQLFQDINTVDYFPDMLWNYKLPKAIPQTKVLGISVINPKHKQGKEALYDDYVKSHQLLVNTYKERGYEIRLYSFCAAEGDLEVCESIKGNDTSIKVIGYSGDISSCLQSIGECSEFIAARFHACIIAIKYNIPLIPIIYSVKTLSLLEDINYPLDTIDLENIKEVINTSFYLFDQQLINTIVDKSSEHLLLHV